MTTSSRQLPTKDAPSAGGCGHPPLQESRTAPGTLNRNLVVLAGIYIPNNFSVFFTAFFVVSATLAFCFLLWYNAFRFAKRGIFL